MLTREMGAVKVRAMEEYIPIPQRKVSEQPEIREKIEYSSIEDYLEEVLDPMRTYEPVDKDKLEEI